MQLLLCFSQSLKCTSIPSLNITEALLFEIPKNLLQAFRFLTDSKHSTSSNVLPPSLLHYTSKLMGIAPHIVKTKWFERVQIFVSMKNDRTVVKSPFRDEISQYTFKHVIPILIGYHPINSRHNPAFSFLFICPSEKAPCYFDIHQLTCLKTVSHRSNLP